MMNPAQWGTQRSDGKIVSFFISRESMGHKDKVLSLLLWKVARGSRGQGRSDRKLGHRKSGDTDQEDKNIVNERGVIFGFMLGNFMLSEWMVELHITRSASHRHFPQIFHWKNIKTF